MRPSRRTTVVLAALLLFCLGAAVFSVARLDRLRPASSLEEVLYIPSPKMLKRMSLGYNGLLADIYWTRAVQYFGAKHVQRSRRYDLLPPLLDITSQLDPHLLAVYEVGSIFLAEPPPNGAGDPDRAVQLVQYGVQENPDEWRLYYQLGFIQFLEKKNYLAAAQAFEQGSKAPGAHPWMKLLAARMAQRGGDLETARFLWNTTYESTRDKQIKANAIAHLRALKVDEDVPKLEEMVLAYFRRSGHYPENWQELIRAGIIPGIPVDPVGNPYKLVPGGKVEVAVPDDLPFITEGLPPGVQASQRPKL